MKKKLFSLLLKYGNLSRQAGFSKHQLTPFLWISLALFWVLEISGFDSVLTWRHPPGHCDSGGPALLEVISKVAVKVCEELWLLVHFY